MSESEKLQKVLARAGYGSRRQIETWIEAGRVTVNDTLAKLGDRVTATDRICVDGQALQAHRLAGAKRRVLAYYKTEGEVCTRSDPEGRPTIYANLPVLRSGRWIAVGRLDINSSGLILLTTDGELANALMHPSTGLEREYAVRVLGKVDDAMLRRLAEGVMLDDGIAAFNNIKDVGGPGANHWYHVTLTEGRNREVRRLWESQGVKVSRLTRVRYGPIPLRRSLRAGRCEDLEYADIEILLAATGLTPPAPQPQPPSGYPNRANFRRRR